MRRWLDGGAERAERRAAELLSRLPAPAPDELARERIWRRIERPTPRRPRLLVPALALGGLAALALFLGWPSGGRIELASGEVLRSAPGAGWSEAEAGARLTEGSLIRTGVRGHALLSLSRASLLLDGSTRATVERTGRRAEIALEEGRLVARVAHRLPGEGFTVRAGDYRASVLGTIFAVRERAPDDVEVSVSRGRVAVAGPGGRWFVEAGHAWRSRAPTASGSDWIDEDERHLLAAALSGEPLPPSTPEPAAAPSPLPPVPSVVEAPAASSLDGGTSATSPLGVALAAPTPLPRYARKRVARTEGEVGAPLAAEGRERGGGEPAPVGPPPAPIASPPVVLGPDPYESALALAHAGRAREAAQALRGLVDERGPHADLALYDLARLEERELHDSAAALRDFLRYQAEQPDGALSQEVALSAIELELARPDPDAALAQMERYLASHGSAERAPRVHFLEGELWRGRGAWERALAHYEAAARSGTEPEALYFEAFCDEKLGRADDAARALRDYLRTSPRGRYRGEAEAALAK